MTETEIYNYLQLSNSDFEPRLTNRVTLREYAKKLQEYAVFSGYFYKEQLISLVAVYANTNIVFVPYIHVKKNHRGKKLADKHLDELICEMKLEKKISIKLTVREDSAAHKLYLKHGFYTIRHFNYEGTDILGLELELIL
ncbi:GNAT family N-acetyltransferase [Paraglaciecola sp. MB-3u-78]|uniref:GNAT family N-acetyltransferase n=1 Tax=Paraglaciecola sp. MB-3u-78 TaxID=2058332 RepID=UPI0012FEEF87|nr:GNAT family N-acetyltransferase [Paraglaciecola sp. MB-3u-78]